MAHKVTFEIPARPVGSADIVFAVRCNGRKFGGLRISKGAVVWIAAEKSKGRRLSWDPIDRFAREHGRTVYVGY